MFVEVGVAAAALGASSVRTYYGVGLFADQDNVGSIHIGETAAVTADGTAATDGVRLDAGDHIFIPPSYAETLAEIFAIATDADQKLYLIFPNRQS